MNDQIQILFIWNAVNFLIECLQKMIGEVNGNKFNQSLTKFTFYIITKSITSSDLALCKIFGLVFALNCFNYRDTKRCWNKFYKNNSFNFPSNNFLFGQIIISVKRLENFSNWFQISPWNFLSTKKCIFRIYLKVQSMSHIFNLHHFILPCREIMLLWCKAQIKCFSSRFKVLKYFYQCWYSYNQSYF
jgi:hypothetical protein